MSLIKLTTLITLHLYIQGARGQQNSLNNSPLTGQNNLNQAFQSNTGIKTSSDNLIQNDSSGNLASNRNLQSPVNLQSVISQSPSSLATSFSLQQPQSFVQPISLKLSTVPNFQQTPNIQQTSNFQQPPNPQQPTNLHQLPNHQSQNLQQPSNIPQTLNSADNLFLQQPSGIVQQPQNSYVPTNYQQAAYVQSFQPQLLSYGDSNIQQQPIITPLLQQLSTQSSQGVPISNTAFVSALPSIQTVPSCSYHYVPDVSNLGSNYVQPTANVQYAFVETPQVATTYSALPRIAILSSPNTVSSTSNGIMYGTPTVEVVESPLRVTNDFMNDEEISCEQDNLISLLLALLQTTNKSSKFAPSSSYSVNPFMSSYLNQGSKTSSLKTLLPLILDLLKERKEDCGCHINCQKCDRRHKDKKVIEPQVLGGYSKKRDYSLKEEKELSPKFVRGNKKLRKMKNSITYVSNESYEDEIEDDSEGVSEEDVD